MVNRPQLAAAFKRLTTHGLNAKKPVPIAAGAQPIDGAEQSIGVAGLDELADVGVGHNTSGYCVCAWPMTVLARRDCLGLR